MTMLCVKPACLKTHYIFHRPDIFFVDLLIFLNFLPMQNFSLKGVSFNTEITLGKT